MPWCTTHPLDQVCDVFLLRYGPKSSIDQEGHLATSLAALDISEFVRALGRRGYPHTGI